MINSINSIVYSVLVISIVSVNRNSGRMGIFFDSIYLIVQALINQFELLNVENVCCIKTKLGVNSKG